MSSEKRRLLISSEGTLGIVSGVTKLIRQLLHHAVEKEYEITIVAPRDIYETPQEMLSATRSIRLIRSFPVPFYSELRFCFATRSAIRKIFDDVRPDLVHAFDPYVLGRTVMQESYRRGIPVVASYHTHIPNYLRDYSIDFLNGFFWRWLRSNYEFAAYTLCPTETIVRELEGHGFSSVSKWSRGIDTARFNPRHRDEALRDHLLDGRQYLAVYVGRMAAEKNIEFVIRSLVGSPQIRLVLIGEGPLRKGFEKKYGPLGVHVAGVKTGEELLRYYASSDVFVFGSITETFGQVLNEAMASGLPIVAVNCPVTSEVLSPDPPGCLADHHPERFREAVFAVLQDRSRYSRMARVRAMERTWSSSMAALFDAYDSAIDR